MESTEKIINDSDFLLKFQKDALIEKLKEAEILDGSIIDRRVAYLTFLDEVLRKLFNKGMEEILSGEERKEIDQILNDLVGEMVD